MFLNVITFNESQKKFCISFKLLSLFIITSCVYGQNNDFVELLDYNIAQNDSCLTNKSDYSKFKLAKKDSVINLDSLNIQVESHYKSRTFESLNSFNQFDFKFWLLVNDSFKKQSNLKIRLNYRVNDIQVEQSFIICLINLDSETKDRGSNTPDFVKLPVYFGTDRNYTNSDNLNDAFGTKRSILKYGIVEVSIPHDHRVGEIESPSIWKFEFSENPSKHVMLHEITLLNKENFFSRLADDIQKSDKKSTFLFVHGYNTSFSEAAKRTAQISYDLKFDGKAVFYSWPSKASTLRYGMDEKNIEWSQKNIKRFLEDYLSKSKAEEIYLVAHSMGNRGLTQALIEVMENQPELRSRIKEIILAAPDIDADVFKNDIAPQMISKTKKPITLYVSSDDLALKASKLLHGNDRAGDAGDKMVIIDGIETIDATGIDTSFLSHSYFADTNSIISDIFDIIQSGQRALNRKHLLTTKLKNNIYWKIKQ
ncbi:alpha/beta hydrolase [Winogradskyella ouciana]|uniref:Alpha/beta hydrolase n=1 Tax=Winogradskyella ouciana TaxID=2608631 RepID=A0A7K1GHV6_9FLAO|nr:alpha/beta hydrolase [Winogradskyella ouciana]MTE28254.1 alpha/beta hydrolase [Winogradskyella ouciana]